MTTVLHLIRQEILAIKPFDTARPGFGTATLLDANESAWNHHNSSGVQLNRYVDCQWDPKILDPLSAYYNVLPSQILLTRGSCEGIDLLVRAFCRAYQDAIVVCPPTFSVFALCAAYQGAEVINVPLLKDKNFTLDKQALLNSITDNTKLVFICSPNNPTGNTVPFSDIQEIIKSLENKAMVIVDEAYIEFSNNQSAATLINEYSNVVVLRTLSKAFGLAGVRAGILLTQNPLIKILASMMMPFPYSILVTDAIRHAFMPKTLTAMKNQIAYTLEQKEIIEQALKLMPIVKKINKGNGNFLFIEFENGGTVLKAFNEVGILVRHFIGVPGYENWLRITIGLEAQNQLLLKMLHQLCENAKATLS